MDLQGFFGGAAHDVTTDAELEQVPHVGGNVGGGGAEQGNNEIVIGDDNTEQAHKQGSPVTLQPAFAVGFGRDDAGGDFELFHLSGKDTFLQGGFDLDGLVDDIKKIA